MLKRVFITWLMAIFLCGYGSMSGQDATFSQYYASPLHVNPSLTGLIDGSYRLQGSYRDQWKGLTSNPFVHMSFGGDIRFKVNKKSKGTDLYGVGLNFSSNRVGILDFATNELGIFGAYHKLLGGSSKQFLSGGFKLGIVQRGISYANLNFQDEFDGISDFSQNSAENLPANVIGYVDFSLGLNISGEASQYANYSVGLALHHVNSPRTSFLNPTDIGANIGDPERFELDSRLVVQGLTEILITNFYSISPRMLWTMQGDFQELRVGSNFKYRLLEKKLSSWHFGVGLNIVDDLNNYSLESATLLMGIEYKAVNIGMSYDISIRDIRDNSSLRQRGFELSVSYFGDYENEVFYCPEF